MPSNRADRRTPAPSGCARILLLLTASLALAIAPLRAEAQLLRFISQWGAYGSGAGQFDTPIGVAVDGAGRVYVTDYGNARVEVFSPDGGFLAQWTTLTPGYSTPVGVAVSPGGDVYVTEHTTNCIKVFSNDGTLLRRFGTAGTGPGQFNSPYGIALGPDGILYVADTYNRRILAFTGEGAFLRQWQTHDDAQPRTVAVDPAGRVYVGAGPSVQAFSSTGEFLSTFAMPVGMDPIIEARGVAAASNRVLVAEVGRRRVIEFTAGGVFVRQTTGLGIGGQFNNPTALCVDANGDVFVTDTGNHRVVRLGDVVPSVETTWGRLKVLFR